MRYDTKLLWLLPLMLLCVIGVFILKKMNRGAVEPPQPIPVGEGTVLAQNSRGIPTEALKPFSNHLDANGVKTMLPVDYVAGMPLVEVRFMQSTMNRRVIPMKVETVELTQIGGTFGGGYSIGGTAMRMAAGNTPSPRTFVCGREYLVRAFRVEGTMDAVDTRPLEPKFRVPDKMEPNTVYMVNLVLKDELLESELGAKKQAEAEEMKRLAVEEQIVVRATEYLPGRLVGIYDDGTRSREFYSANGERSLVLKGPNRLGGELMVYGMGADGRTQEAWAYTPKLDKRQVDMPKDAQLMVRKGDLIPITIGLTGARAELLSRYNGIGLYFSEATHIPLFLTSLPKSSVQGEPANVSVSIKVKPGTYAVRLMDDKMESLPVTILTIGSEPSRTYTVELPAPTPASKP